MSVRPLRHAPVAIAVLALALGAGCKKEDAAPSPPLDKGSGAGPKPPGSPGEALFTQKGCVRCHSTGGAGEAAAGPKGKRMGPDLSKVGADPAHTPEWFASYVRDPHGQNPASKMPKHDETKISEQEMETLVAYLSSLK